MNLYWKVTCKRECAKDSVRQYTYIYISKGIFNHSIYILVLGVGFGLLGRLESTSRRNSGYEKRRKRSVMFESSNRLCLALNKYVSLNYVYFLYETRVMYVHAIKGLTELSTFSSII